MSKTKTIYCYSRVTGEFICDAQADESPREPGEFLIPAFSTTTPPPPLAVNQAAVFNSETDDWDVVADHRGAQYFEIESGTPSSITELGITPESAGLTDQVPPEGPAMWTGSAWTIDMIRQEELEREAIAKQIDSLEREYMLPRGTREALMALTLQVAATAGVTEAQLYATNIAYRKIKDFDAQIIALRAQL